MVSWQSSVPVAVCGIMVSEPHMSKTIEAVFDGEVLRPDESLGLEPNTRVLITIEGLDEPASRSFLRTAKSLNLDGPKDWSIRTDEYLYQMSD
jgi:predicted DNA-binding antitoxin AbrB/MazE fold protein